MPKQTCGRSHVAVGPHPYDVSGTTSCRYPLISHSYLAVECSCDCRNSRARKGLYFLAMYYSSLSATCEAAQMNPYTGWLGDTAPAQPRDAYVLTALFLLLHARGRQGTAAKMK